MELIGCLLVILWVYFLIQKSNDWINEREWRRSIERKIAEDHKRWKEAGLE